MAGESRNLGRSYLVRKLGDHGVSRRRAVRVLDLVFDEMRRELERGREVEFPFGCLKRVKRVSREWELIGDEPMKPYTVEHQLDAAGYKLLNGEGDPDELALITFERTGKVPVRKPLTGKQVEVTGR